MATSRITPRALAGPLLIFVGALLIVAAIAMPLYLTDQLKKTSMDTDYTTVSPATQSGDAKVAMPAKILDPCSTTGKKPDVVPASLTQQQRVVVVKPSSSDTATFQAGSSTRIDRVQVGDEVITPSDDPGCRNAILSATVDKVTTNRSSGAAVKGTSELSTIAGSEPSQIPDRHGVQYRLPFDVSTKKSYAFYDLPSRQSQALKYADSADRDGRKIVHFTQDIKDVNLAQVGDDAPALGTQLVQKASWYGKFKGIDPKSSLPSDVYYSVTRDLYVDQATGTIVNQREHVTKTLKFSGLSSDSPANLRNYSLTALDATFAYDDATQKQRISAAKDIESPIKLYGLWLPIVFGVVGALALIAGIIALLRSPRTRTTHPVSDPYYPVATHEPAASREAPTAPTQAAATPDGVTTPHGSDGYDATVQQAASGRSVPAQPPLARDDSATDRFRAIGDESLRQDEPHTPDEHRVQDEPPRFSNDDRGEGVEPPTAESPWRRSDEP